MKGVTIRDYIGNEKEVSAYEVRYMGPPEEENSYAYAVKMKDGKYARLKIEVSDECPEWAKDVLEGGTE